jgi:hypothetical protein
VERLVTALCLGGLLGGLLAACPGPPIDQANPCIDGPPNDEPSACPSPPPSYTTDVLPVLEASCLLCHTPFEPDGGANPQYASPTNLTTYAQQFALKGTLLSQLLTCQMPNLDAGATPLDEAQRLTLMGWVICGAPGPDAG